MTPVAAPPRRLRRGVSFALGALSAIAGIVVPPVPLIYRGAWGLATVASFLWFGALDVFFEYFAGPGFLAHLALSFLAFVGLLAPRRLARLEIRLRGLVGWRRSDKPPIAESHSR